RLLAEYPSLELGIVDHVAAAEEGVQAVVVFLQIVLDERVVVALGTLEVHAQEESANVLRQQVGLSLADEVELGGGAGFGVGAIGGEDLLDELVPGFVGGKGGAQELVPLGRRDVLARAPLQEHGV